MNNKNLKLNIPEHARGLADLEELDLKGLHKHFVRTLFSSDCTTTISSLSKLMTVLGLPLQYLFETPKGFKDIYDNTGNWLGVVRKGSELSKKYSA